ncbi:MAG: hypothetical protein OEZ30_08640, partial [Candidatus Aminicenantes bacterium]|nr:hypothetical protein [Candidatus Aminicenantes bacterium]
EVRGAHQNPFASVPCSIIANLSGASLADDGWYLFRLRGVLLTLLSSGSGKPLLSTPNLLPAGLPKGSEKPSLSVLTS